MFMPSLSPTCTSSWWYTVNNQVRDSLVRLCPQWRRLRPKDHLERYARWTGSPGTPKSWPTQDAGAGRTPLGEKGPNGSTGFLTLPGEKCSPPGIGPKNFNMMDTNNLEKSC